MGHFERYRIGKKGVIVAILFLTFSLVVPLLFIRITGFGMLHTGKVDLTSSNIAWFNGTIIIECEDGYTERIYIRYPVNLPPLGPDELVQTGSLVNRDFTKPTLCTLTFTIPALGLTIGPFQFQSYQDKILYHDDDENKVEWVVMDSQVNDISNSRRSDGSIACFSVKSKGVVTFAHLPYYTRVSNPTNIDHISWSNRL